MPVTSDDTAGFLAARTAAAGKTLVIPPGLYKVGDVVEFTSDNMTVEAHGAIINLVDDGTTTGRIFLAIDCGSFAWLGGKLTQAAAARTGSYGLLTLVRVEGADVDLITDGGSSCGVWAAEGGDHRYRVRVANSTADGLYLSRGLRAPQLVPHSSATLGMTLSASCRRNNARWRSRIRGLCR